MGLSEYLPPHSLEAEMACLGSTLMSRTAAEQLSGLAERDDFYLEAHRKIYDVVTYLAENSDPVDLLTVPEELRRRDQLESVGGLAYVLELAESVPTAAHVEYYARTVTDKSIVRRLITAADEIKAVAYTEAEEVPQLLDLAAQLITSVHTRDAADSALTLGEVVATTLPWFHPDCERERGLETSFPGINRLTGGLFPADLIVVAGRPSMGKSSVGVVQMALDVARKGVGVLVYSLEMKRHLLLARFFANVAHVDSLHILKRKYAGREWDQVMDAMQVLEQLPIYIHDRGDITALGLAAHARREKRAHPEIGLVIVDHLQEFELDPRMNPHHATKLNVKTLKKRVAEPLALPVILCCQLNRSVDGKDRKDKRPQMSDLRESGSIEEHADGIWFPFRPSYYLAGEGGDEPTEGVTELIVRKSRMGRRGTVLLNHHLAFCRYWEPTAVYADEDAAPQRTPYVDALADQGFLPEVWAQEPPPERERGY